MAWQDRPYYRERGGASTNPLMWFLTGSVSLFNVFGIHVRAHASLILTIGLVLIFGLGPGFGAIDRVQSMGVMERETKAESKTAPATTTPNSRNKRSTSRRCCWFSTVISRSALLNSLMFSRSLVYSKQATHIVFPRGERFESDSSIIV